MVTFTSVETNMSLLPLMIRTVQYSSTFTTPSGVTTKGEEMEVVNRIVTSGDNGLSEPMSVRLETHLLDKLADIDNTTRADRTYQAKYLRSGIVREDVISTHQDTRAPGSHSDNKYIDTKEMKIFEWENVMTIVHLTQS